MVCLGNICRSPLAEGIMQEKVAETGLGWEIDSAGTGAWHIGNPPDPRSIAVAHKYGLDIANQRARQFKAKDLQKFDLILAMDNSNQSDILRHAKNDIERNKVRLILSYTHPSEERSVPDPYWDDNGFEAVFAMLGEACEMILKEHN